ncbi:MAG: polysaccharide deacetylase family protein [Candidatus Methylacidiphilales bacterium]|nr:polysaccharide deacetylase family protein [Candidatus Methylacidiphilales bacterium]
MTRFLFGMMLALQLFTAAVHAQDLGKTRIATWKDDKKGAFMLMFDDCCPSHVNNVYPALKEKNMTGTFYVVVNKGERKAKAAFWEEQAPKEPFMVYGNHTVNHNGFKDVENADQELLGCNEFIYKYCAGKNPRLLSYATPGGVPIKISKDELKTLLTKYNLVERPTFNGHGGAIHQKTSDEVLKLADKAISSGTAEYIIFHGVGGDWIPFDLAQFQLLVDGLDAKKTDLWIADHISVHQYEKERAATTVTVAAADARKIQLTLKCSEDAAFYDLPLTFVTTAPANWTRCQVVQGDKKQVVDVKAGSVMFNALPNGSVTLTPAS